ncbi:Ty3/gypsy retrotransposon protein [Quillaja saponaria]|uniref:Ty3/gypsy retrotransposon protein n=1 Tax=Quillaja saponaria TaxID=32244 RepID=A0AAD7QJ66_QUISA|nr:Ty3/gypsy retrotransposon protein [Quillaja saponaria]
MEVYGIHGLPEEIIFDRDTVCLGFGIGTVKLQQVKLHYSTAYHPQVDGQTEDSKEISGDLLKKPPSHIPFVRKDSSNDMVDISLIDKEVIIQLLKQDLKQAQERSKMQADKYRSGTSDYTKQENNQKS